jgi:dTDP-4-amino-4,6-dideoxygalactose transaminase
VVATLRAGWLTTGPRARRFEECFRAAVGARHAVALNSCTGALHLAVEALGLDAGAVVVVPTMTFAATAEVVRYRGAYPLLTDCDERTLHLDVADAERRLERWPGATDLAGNVVPERVAGVIPVHVAGSMMDLDGVSRLAERHRAWVVEDAAHAFPAAWRRTERNGWRRCGEGGSRVACFSFYANKTITTGEGGMAVTDDGELAERIRRLSLHGLTLGAADRYSQSGRPDYEITAPGYKYNLTDIAASLGIHQVARAESMRVRRQRIAERYLAAWHDLDELELPPVDPNRIHAWHLFPVRLHLERLDADRDQILVDLKERGVGCSVHWKPLHLHAYYRERYGWRPEDFPVATRVWRRLVSVPLFSAMSDAEVEHVAETVREVCRRHAR